MPIRVVAHSEETCALDVAGRGVIGRDQIGILIGLTGRRVGQLEDRAKVKLRAREIVDAALLTVPGIGWVWGQHQVTTHAAVCTIHVVRARASLVMAALNLVASDWPEGITLEQEWDRRGELCVCTAVVLLGDESQIASVARAWEIKAESSTRRRP
jgi:hypothetical protein